TFEPFDKPRAERAGADSFVTKPFDSQALASVVRDLVQKAAEERAAAPPEPPPAPEPPPPPPPPAASPPSVEEPAESTDPTQSGPATFLTLPLAAMQPAQPVPEEKLPDEDIYATSAIPVFRETEIEIPMPPEAAPGVVAPPSDPLTEPLGLPLTPAANSLTPAADYEVDLGALDDEPSHRDLDEDIAAFEASGRSTTRPDLWDSPAVKAAAADLEGPASSEEHSPGDLEALAAEASLTELKSLIPQAAAAASAAVAAGPLSDDDIDRIARRVLELSGERIVRKIAWDVVPELAERLVKERLEELERAD
ncbi:MAG: hypothetical protein NEA02_05605, partial [Thermoanaerobaculia bacterium]|nr:hypothetical protein [Thermoanaerobaculia bacterium]